MNFVFRDKLGRGVRGAPEFQFLLPAYRDLIENVRKAEAVFTFGGDGGREGCKMACQAVIRFLGVRHEEPEIAAPPNLRPAD
jgi:hypothetical protein